MQQQSPSGGGTAGAGHWCAQVVSSAQTAPQSAAYAPQSAPVHSQYSSYSSYSQTYAPNQAQGYQYNQGGYQYYQQPAAQQQQQQNAYYAYPTHAQQQQPLAMSSYYANYNAPAATPAPSYAPPAGAYYAQTPATHAASHSAPATATVTPTPVARPQPSTSTMAARPNPARFQAASTPAPAAAAPAVSNQPWPPSLSRFCERAFKECESNDDRKLMEGYLRDILSKVTAEKRLHSHQWELEIVPDLETLRAKAAAPAEAPRKRSRWQNGPAQHHGATAPAATVQVHKTPAKKGGNSFVVDDHELQMREQRMRRFQRPEQHVSKREQKKRKQRMRQMEFAAAAAVASSGTEIDLDQFIVKGTCTELEKDYFRLTSAPDPSTVRPKPVLERALARLKERWSNKEVEYLYMCSQLKAIRQDLTVQHFKDEFTVQVYEYHGRVALEEGDLNEYNQCQTQLKELYRMGLAGCQLEFTAYRILYYLYMLGNKKYNTGSAELMRLIAELPDSALQDEGVAHALLVRRALFDNNYHRFFLLYGSTPNHGMYILDMCVDRIRVDSLRKILKAYRPTIAVGFIQQELAFEDLDQCVEFCRKCNIPVADDGEIDAKNAELDPTELFQQNSLL